MPIVSSTVGSATKTGWKRRSSAPSFSMYLRYSSSVVAPVQRRSARARHSFWQVGGAVRHPAPASADDRVGLVDEDDDLAVRLLDLAQQPADALLELAAVLRPGDQAAEVDLVDALRAQPLGHVAAHD